MSHSVCMGTDVGDPWPAPPAHPQCDVVSQGCGCHRAWGGSCAAQVRAGPTFGGVPSARGLPIAHSGPSLLPSASLCPKLLGCALAQSQRLLGEASCPGSPPGLGSSERFSGEALGSACCRGPEGPPRLGGLLAVRPALLLACSPSQNLQGPGPETLNPVQGHPAPGSLEFMKRRLFPGAWEVRSGQPGNPNESREG